MKIYQFRNYNKRHMLLGVTVTGIHCLLVLYGKNHSKTYTAQKIKFSIEDFFSKCDQIRSFLRIWSHLLKKFLMESSFFVQ